MMPNVFFASLKMAMMSSVITSPAMQSGKQGGKTPTFSARILPADSYKNQLSVRLFRMALR